MRFHLISIFLLQIKTARLRKYFTNKVLKSVGSALLFILCVRKFFLHLIVKCTGPLKLRELLFDPGD